MRGRWVLTFVTAFVWLGCGEKASKKAQALRKTRPPLRRRIPRPGADEKVEEEAEKAEEKSAVVVYSGRGGFGWAPV